jgi:DNA-binding NarL/FixJ family response regulator
MKLLIIDDSQKVTTNLKKLLTSMNDVEVVGTAEDVSSGIKAINKYSPDTVIIDILMPEGTGFDVLKHVKDNYPDMTSIMLTNFSNERFKIKAVEDGADYFFDKSNDIDKLIDTLSYISKKNNINM